MRRLCAVLLPLLLCTGCVDPPEGIEPIRGFTLERYLGTWYEIARLDHSFERGLDRVTATYSMREDGGVRVLNRGFRAKDGEWKDAEGKAYFVGSPDTGLLKVSFFGPFYGGYVIIDLDSSYTTAMVCGPSLSYLWILSRTPRIDDAVRTRLIEKARSLGFPVDELIFPAHDA